MITIPEGKERHGVTPRHGEKFQIQPKSAHSIGHRWHLLSYDQEALNLISCEFVPKIANLIGVEVWSVLALKQQRKARQR